MTMLFRIQTAQSRDRTIQKHHTARDRAAGQARVDHQGIAQA